MKMSLEDYKETKILTTDLMVNVAILSIPTIPKRWISITNDIEEILIKVKEFEQVCWPDIKRINLEQVLYNTFSFIHENTQLLTLSTAGRILNTIKNDDKKMITIMGKASHESHSSCGIQGIYATKEEAIGLIQTIISNWGPKKYKFSKNLSL